jgi:hypothetical protein
MAHDLDKQYYPFLKGKKGELDALHSLRVEGRQGMTPLFDVPPERVRFFGVGGKRQIQIDTVAEALDGYAAKLVRAWGQVDSCFVDLAGFDPASRLPSRVHPVSAFFADAKRVGLAAIPVTGPERDRAQVSAVAAVCASWLCGAAVRLRGPILEDSGQMTAKLGSLCARLSLQPHEIDLLVDLGEITPRRAPELRALAVAVLKGLPDVEDWRTLVLCGGAFPSRLGNFVKRNETKGLPRRDWTLWRSLSTAGLPRMPAFADCGVAAANWGSAFDPEMSVSAKIIYATPEEWIAVKGEKIRKDQDSQFYELARRLVKESGAFRGERHCSACRQIVEAKKHIGPPGSLTTWVTRATRHHLAAVKRQLASLS